MKVQNWSSAAILALAVAACGEAPEGGNIVAEHARVPIELCNQVATGLAEIKKKGGIEEDGKGEAVIVEEAWLRMNGDQRSELARLIAFKLACGDAGPSAEQNVVFRSEYGRILSQQVVDTRVDMGRILPD